MADNSTKHGPRVDDALKEDTGSRAEEWRRWEGPEDAEPGQRTHREDVDATTPGALEEREVETRTELARFVVPSVFPATRDTLVSAALSEHAPDWVLDVMKRLPEDREFATVEEMWEAAGGRGESRNL